MVYFFLFHFQSWCPVSFACVIGTNEYQFILLDAVSVCLLLDVVYSAVLKYIIKNIFSDLILLRLLSRMSWFSLFFVALILWLFR